MPVTLINVKRPPQPLTYNLEHNAHRQTLKWLKAVEGKRGETVFKREGKSIGGSITLMAKGTRGSSLDGLPDTILACSEIEAAIARGDIRSKRVAAKPVEAKPVETKPAPVEAKETPAPAPDPKASDDEPAPAKPKKGRRGHKADKG